MSDKFGGPAFPVSTMPASNVESYGHQDSSHTWQYPGMSLRDYFAAKAMQAAVAAAAGWSACDFREDMDCDALASFAYRQAEAMLKAREATNV